MMITNRTLEPVYKDLYDKLSSKYPNETLYLNAVKSFLETIAVVDLKGIYLDDVSRILEPNMIHTFDLEFINDQGLCHIYQGYRVQHSNMLGVYKGGLRFHPSVDVSSLKFLAFEQTLKNSLTGLPLGGAKGGSNFDPKGKSLIELERFSKLFMSKLKPFIGVGIDVPAGDIGVGGQEIKWMIESYANNQDQNMGFITGKPVELSGSFARTEATGYGLCYISQAALKHFCNQSFKDKRVIVSGSGNVSIHAAYMAQSLGAKVVGMSDSSGYIYDAKGIDIDYVESIKSNRSARIKNYLEKYPNVKYQPESKNLFLELADIFLPCATQSEIDLETVKKMDLRNVLLIAEGANRPITNEAIHDILKSNVIYIPGKASNAGGVVVSYLEMEQNRRKEQWSFEVVDQKLKAIMEDIFARICKTASQFKMPRNLLLGANMAGFLRLVNSKE